MIPLHLKAEFLNAVFTSMVAVVGVEIGCKIWKENNSWKENTPPLNYDPVGYDPVKARLSEE